MKWRIRSKFFHNFRSSLGSSPSEIERQIRSDAFQACLFNCLDTEEVIAMVKLCAVEVTLNWSCSSINQLLCLPLAFALINKFSFLSLTSPLVQVKSCERWQMLFPFRLFLSLSHTQSILFLLDEQLDAQLTSDKSIQMKFVPVAEFASKCFEHIYHLQN